MKNSKEWNYKKLCAHHRQNCDTIHHQKR